MIENIIDECERGHNFPTAVEFLKRNNKMTRTGWSGSGLYVELQMPDEHSKMSLPYLFLHTSEGDLVPWVPGHSDIMASDWAVVNGQTLDPNKED